MANIMSMKSVRNHVHRDGFDLSSKRAFSAKLGELLPVLCEDVMPGDKFKISADWFTRTQPVTSPAFTRFGEYYDFFFVPYHLLWRYFPQFIIQTNDDSWATSIVGNASQFSQHPYFSNKEFYSLMQRSFASVSTPSADRDEVGQPIVYGMLKLFSYLGYGSFGLQDLSLDDGTHTIIPKQDKKVVASGAGVTGEGGETEKQGETKKPDDAEKSGAPQSTPTVTPQATKKPAKKSAKPKKVTNGREFTVRGGLLSSSVAREMKEAGIINNADAFDEYLEKSGNAKKVRAGTYKIPKGASYEQIARIITRQD